MSKSHESVTDLHSETRSSTHSTVFWTQRCVSPYSHSGSNRGSLFFITLRGSCVYNALSCWAARENPMGQIYREYAAGYQEMTEYAGGQLSYTTATGKITTRAAVAIYAPTPFEQSEKNDATHQVLLLSIPSKGHQVPKSPVTTFPVSSILYFRGTPDAPAIPPLDHSVTTSKWLRCRASRVSYGHSSSFQA
ncbi:hypothetical protein PTI98_005774 [Pleurotus ostreatus]|nr:hypothetical protein PTI98_005774 [Pleurotus ostreatus]